MIIKNRILRDIVGWINIPVIIIKIRRWDLDTLVFFHNLLLKISIESPHRNKEGSFRILRKIVLNRMVNISLDLWKKGN